ncbi:MAG: phage portal protein, partial [Pseudomonadota bacterium]
MVFDFMRRTPAGPVEAKASATGPVIAFRGSGRVAWSPRDTSSLMRNGFSGNPVGFRSVRMISEAAAAVPLNVQDKTSRYDQHPIVDLISRPNQGQGMAELFEGLYAQLLLSGNAFIEAVV